MGFGLHRQRGQRGATSTIGAPSASGPVAGRPTLPPPAPESAVSVGVLTPSAGIPRPPLDGLHDPTPAEGVGLLAGRASAAAIATGSPTALNADEVRRVERTLIVAMSNGASLPSLRSLANVAGVTKQRLRRAIGSVEIAAQAIVDDRMSIARSCTSMSIGWHPSLEVIGGRIVTHRLFVYSVVVDIVDAAAHSAPTAADFAELEHRLDDELRYQIRRWRVFDRETTEELVREIGSIFSFARIRSVDHATREQLERRLNHDLQVVFARFDAVHRWNEYRHEWFAEAPVER